MYWWVVPVHQQTMPSKDTVGVQPCCLCWSPPAWAHPQWSCPPDPWWEKAEELSVTAPSNKRSVTEVNAHNKYNGQCKSSETASVIIKLIQLALIVTSLLSAPLLKCFIHKSWNMKVKIFYPNLDARASGSTQPIAVGAEAEGVDGVTALQGVQVFALIQIPQHGLTILDAENMHMSTFLQ